MEIREIMTKRVVTATPEETVSVVARKMRDADIGCVVIQKDHTVVGIVTARNLAINCMSEEHDPQTCTASEHMTSPVVAVPPTLDVLDAAEIMTREQVKRLPVVQGTQLVGLVSFSDVAPTIVRRMNKLLLSTGPARHAA